MGISILFVSSVMGAIAAVIAVTLAGVSPIGGLGIYSFVGAGMFLAWVAELAYYDHHQQ